MRTLGHARRRFSNRFIAMHGSARIIFHALRGPQRGFRRARSRGRESLGVACATEFRLQGFHFAPYILGGGILRAGIVGGVVRPQHLRKFGHFGPYLLVVDQSGLQRL
ncbi:MAG: hypothetical protein KF864_09930 [Phycisphaeraceae bacterium]|nr:hypothetical protein [Phycisphaeraceae bacterium]